MSGIVLQKQSSHVETRGRGKTNPSASSLRSSEPPLLRGEDFSRATSYKRDYFSRAMSYRLQAGYFSRATSQSQKPKPCVLSPPLPLGRVRWLELARDGGVLHPLKTQGVTPSPQLSEFPQSYPSNTPAYEFHAWGRRHANNTLASSRD